MKQYKNRTILCLLLTVYCLLLTVNVYASVWQKPVLIDAGTGDAFRTNIAFDPYGNAMAVFEQYTDGFSRIYANQFLFNKNGWQRPVIIDAGPSNAYVSRVAFNQSGDAIAIFKQSDGSIYRISSRPGRAVLTGRRRPAGAVGTGDAD